MCAVVEVRRPRELAPAVTPPGDIVGDAPRGRDPRDECEDTRGDPLPIGFDFIASHPNAACFEDNAAPAVDFREQGGAKEEENRG